MISRRGLLGAFAAPAIIRVIDLMPVKVQPKTVAEIMAEYEQLVLQPVLDRIMQTEEFMQAYTNMLLYGNGQFDPAKAMREINLDINFPAT